MGVVAVFILLRISTIQDTIQVLRTMSYWMLGFAVAAQCLSYLSSGYQIKLIVYERQNFRWLIRGTLIYIAAESVGLAGGMASAMAATYYWVWREKGSPAQGVLSGVLPFIYNSASLITISIIGMIYLLIMHDLTGNQAVFYSAILAVLLLGFLVIIYFLFRRDRLEKLIFYSTEKLSRFRKRSYDLTNFMKSLDNFYDGIKVLSNGGWIRYGTGPALNILFDILTLYIFFLAAGFYIRPSILIAGYSLAFLFGRSTFFIPGGSGVIEAGMVAIYASLSVPSQIAVVAVFGYRFLSFWLPSILGLAVCCISGKVTGRWTSW